MNQATMIPSQLMLSAGGSTTSPTLRCAAEIAPVQTQWIAQDYLAAGRVHLLTGPRGTGKSTIALDMAAKISSGSPWYQSGTPSHGHVMIWSAKRYFDEIALPRLIAANANRSAIHHITHGAEAANQNSLLACIHKMAHRIREIRNMKLLIVDSLEENIAKNNLHQCATAMNILAEETNIAVLVISHTDRAGRRRDPIERVTSNHPLRGTDIIFLTAAREGDCATDERRFKGIMVKVQCRVHSSSFGGLQYELVPTVLHNGAQQLSALTLQGAIPVPGSPKSLLQMADDSACLMDQSRERNAAWLAQALRQGPMQKAHLVEWAEREGMSESELESARRVLGVRSTKGRGAGRASPWYWALPERVNTSAVPPTSIASAATAPPLPVQQVISQQGSSPYGSSPRLQQRLISQNLPRVNYLHGNHTLPEHHLPRDGAMRPASPFPSNGWAGQVPAYEVPPQDFGRQAYPPGYLETIGMGRPAVTSPAAHQSGESAYGAGIQRTSAVTGAPPIQPTGPHGTFPAQNWD